MKPTHIFRPYKTYATGGVGSGASVLRPSSAILTDTNHLTVTFNRCAAVDPLHAGVEYSLDAGGLWSVMGARFATAYPWEWEFSMPVPASEGDNVRWRYTPGGGGITDCETPAVEMEAAEISVANPIDTTAPFIVSAEVGAEGANIVHIMMSEPVLTDDRTIGWHITSTSGPNTVVHVTSEFPSMIYLVLGTPIEVGETVFLEYEGAPVGDVTDVSGWPALNVLGDELMFPVTNNVVDTGVDTEPPMVFDLVANGGSSVAYDAEVPINTFVASDNATAAEDLMYQVKVSPPYPLTTPPPVDDPNWLTFANRLTPVTLPGQGSYTLTAYAMDEAGNVSRGLLDAQEPVTAPNPFPAFKALGYDPITFELDGVQKGIGELTNARVAVINVPDHEGIYRRIPTATVAYPKSRIVRNDCKYSDYNGAGVIGVPAGTNPPTIVKTTYLGENVEAITFSAGVGSYADSRRDGQAAPGLSNIVGCATIAFAAGQLVAYRVSLALSRQLTGSESIVVTVHGASGLSSVLTLNSASTVNPDIIVGEASTFAGSGANSREAIYIYPTNTLNSSITLYIKNAMIGVSANAVQEYVATNGVAGVVKQFACANGNTVTNGIVTEAVGAPLDPQPYALSAPAATNIVRSSYNLVSTGWIGSGTGISVLNAIGLFGLPDTASTLTDNDAGTHEAVYISESVPVSALVTSRVFIQRDSNQTRFPAIQPITVGGSSVNYGAYLNTATGAIHQYAAVGRVSVKEQIIGGVSWWVVLYETQQSATNNVYRLWLYPALSSNFGNNVVETTGSCVVGQVESYVGKTLEQVDGLPIIVTNGAGVTRDKDVIAAPSGDLNATQGSIYFEIIPTSGNINLISTFVKLVNNFAVLDDGTNANATASTSLVDNDVLSKIGIIWSSSGMKICVNGKWSLLVPYDGSLLSGALDIFRDSTDVQYMKNWKIWDVASEAAIDDLMPTPIDFGTDFVMVVKTTAASETFTLPCGNDGTYNAVIDWGDGGATSAITTYNDADLVHTYATAGNHTIRISGTLPWIYFNNAGDRLKVTGVLNGGSIGSRLCNSMFYGCSNLTAIDLSGFDTALVTNMSFMFHGCSSLTSLDLSGFDTSRVTNMYSMFRSCSNLTSLDLSGFDTALVTNMSFMFYGCSNLTTLDGAVLGNADIVSDTANMFAIATALSQASLDSILAKMYANRANYTWATPVLDLSPPTAQPSGVYQDATPPTTGKEFAYKLDNDPDAEGFNTWAITL